jgi:DNA-binding HxlR family transcriptional regulator
MQATTDPAAAAIENSGPVPDRRTAVASGALAGALERVGDRWSLLVVDALGAGPRRFADLQEDIPGIATNVLSQRLRRLEADRILLAVPYSRRPLRYAYELTATGRALGGAARLLAQWNSDQGWSEEPTPAHEVCGAPMEVRWFCAACDRIADVEGDDVVWV